MKIISKFKDYYDGVQSLGIDTHVIYFRTTDIIDIPDLDEFGAAFNQQLEYRDYMQMVSNASHKHSHILLTKAIIGFCGLLYECYVVLEFTDPSTLNQQFFHSKAELLNYLQSRSKDFQLDDLERYIPTLLRHRKKLQWPDAIAELKLPDTKSTHDVLFHALQQPIFLYPAYIYDTEFWANSMWRRRYEKFQGKDLIINPRLHDLDFQKVKDAYQCYQELDMYLSGVLGQKENPTDTRTDIEKVKSHGFDEKYGFRKRKNT